MKKILILNGSPRKRATYKVLNKIAASLENNDVTHINVRDYEISHCIGCENCLRKGKCNIKDDAELILSQMNDADGIVIGTPVYLRQISGYLKVLFDRACAWYHRSPLVGKPVLFVTTTQVTGLKQTNRYLNDLAIQWGVINAGSIERTMFNLDKKIEVKALKRFEYFLNDNNKRNYRPSLKEVIEFNTQKVLGLNILPLDREYWLEKGYDKQAYFYRCRINVFIRIIAYIYYRILSHFIIKNKQE